MPDPIEVSADTVEEAIDEALRRLEATEDEVEIRILSEGPTPVRPNDRARVAVRMRDERPPEEMLEEDAEPSAPVTTEELNAQADIVEDFLNGLLDRMDVDADVDVAIEADGVYADLDGEDSGLLIGRHGSTIDALQEITRTVVKAKTGTWPSVTVDVEGYRERREDQITNRARRLAEKAESSGQPVEMPPMTSTERKIVHQALSGMTGVRTESAGEGFERHIVIYPT